MKNKILYGIVVFFCFHAIYGQPGTLDSSFGNNGIVFTAFNDSPVNIYGATGTQVLKGPNRSIYLIFEIGNAYAVITRLLPSGTVDASYGIHGYSKYLRIVANTAALQSDGKILIAGYEPIDFTTEYHMALARFNTDGTLDSTFGRNGKQTTNLGSVNDKASSIAIQSDGKIIAAGFTIDTISSNSVLWRFNGDGTPDSAFSRNGKQIVGSVGNEGTESLALQDDGKIIVAGISEGNFTLVRYYTDGTLDKTFSTVGIQSTEFGVGNSGRSLAIQRDGKIVVAGSSKGNFALVRYNTNGTVDKSFSKDGIQTTDLGSSDDIGSSLAIQSDGKIVVTGSSLAEVLTAPDYTSDTRSLYNFAVARYNTDGSPDLTFSVDGKQNTDFKRTNDKATSIIVQNDGRIVVVGSATVVNYNRDFGYFSEENYFAVARYSTDGDLDPTFSKDGKLADYLHIGYTFYRSTAVQSDGKIVAVGVNQPTGPPSYILTRYNTDGTLDTTFSHDGKVVTPVGEDVALQNDGKIVVVGSVFTGVDFDNFVLTRYNNNGTLDTTFSNNGMELTDFGGSSDGAATVAVQKDNKIVVGGVSYTTGNSADFAIARYNSNGTLDRTFSDDGKQTTEVGGYGGGVRSISIQNDGKVVAIGTAEVNRGNDRTYNFALVRYNTDGTLDYTFSEDGIQTTDFNGFAFSVAIQSDGKIVLAGEGGRHGDFIVARYSTNGSLDTTFSEDGEQIIDFGSPFDAAYSVAIQSDGKIVVAGNNNANFALARYNSNGSLDSTFGENGKQVTDASGSFDYINDIAIFQNKLYAVGSGSIGGSVGVIARYFLDDKTQTPPTVTLISPTKNATYLAPAYFWLRANATDADGTITKVEFYNDTHLLHTETLAPYGFKWKNVPAGNYTLTAKAYDNSGWVTTSTPVHISVVPNKPPIVSIIKPVVKQTVAALGYIHLEAEAKDVDGRIARVEFYNGSTLIRTEYYPPYTYVWKNVPRGTYTITAVAIDNWAARTTSEAVTIRVVNSPATAANKPFPEDYKTNLNDLISINLTPNPANGIVTVNSTGLKPYKQLTLQLISSAGIVMKTVHLKSLSKILQLDVSTLRSGVYTITVISGNNACTRQFVKL